MALLCSEEAGWITGQLIAVDRYRWITCESRHSTIQLRESSTMNGLISSLYGGIGGREDFDANLRGARQKGNVLADLIPTGIKPTDINSFDAVSGRNRALGQCLTLRSKLNQ